MPKGVVYVETYPTTAGQEDEFNEWYDKVHLPEIVALPGFVSARRFAPAEPGRPYIALYEIESDDLQQTVDDMMAKAGRDEFQMSDALQTEPPAVVLTLTTISEYAPKR